MNEAMERGGLVGAWRPQILSLDPRRISRHDWPQRLEDAAGLGFDHVLLASPFAPTPGHDSLLPADARQLHPMIGGGEATPWLADIAAAARQAGLAVILDLRADRVAVGSPLAERSGGLFVPPPPDAALDPRRPERLNEAVAPLNNSDGAARVAEFWRPILAEWQDAGLAGLRLMGLPAMPAAPALLGALRHAHPGLRLLAWTPGCDWAAFRAFGDAGADAVALSLPWWDWRGDWLWQEWRLLAEAASVIAAPAPPFSAPPIDQPHAPAERAADARRGVLFAALAADGWLLPAGWANPAPALAADIRAVNRLRGGLVGTGAPALLSPPDGPVLALQRRAADGRMDILLANADLTHRHAIGAAFLLPRTGCESLEQLFPAGGATLGAGDEWALAPAELRLLHGQAEAPAAHPAPLDPALAEQAATAPRVAIEAVAPAIDGGRFAAKRLAGARMEVQADIVCDGHDLLAAMLLWRRAEDATWQEERMRPLGNDRYVASFPLARIGLHCYAIEAWRDDFASFRDELGKKHNAGVPTGLEIKEGRDKLAAAANAYDDVAALLARFDTSDEAGQRALLLAEDTATAMRAADARPRAVRSAEFPVQAERLGAAFASWYEIFPRSMSDDPHRHGNFADVIRHLPRIRDMGFDVLYFPPIHPIGRSNRKGRNNSLTAGPDDPGSPYAIGGAEGGHDALHPELGTLEDFRALREAAAAQGIELALDFAIQCAPDHPWLRDHKEWFDWRPDGTIKYAENPPKRYEDIVNVDFYAPGAVPGLWIALADVVLFWAAQGVRLFRVDNPHTKPFPFWEWMIAEVRRRYPDAVFLAEAFTRPKIMYRLAKLGFSQSYTYFTWRNTAAELREYLTELTTTAPREFFRPHFFVNTPDINPLFLQSAGRAGFRIRAALAATLSGLWGVYCGFELCEAASLPGREEYGDSEKYQIRAWDWDRPGNIVADITLLNRARRANPALQTHLGVTFLDQYNDTILVYEKATADRGNVILVVVSLDPHQPQETDVTLPLWRWNLPDDAALDVTDLASDARFAWHGTMQHLRLTPDEPYRLFRLHPI